jgi:hypothetical protein
MILHIYCSLQEIGLQDHEFIRLSPVNVDMQATWLYNGTQRYSNVEHACVTCVFVHICVNKHLKHKQRYSYTYLHTLMGTHLH